MTSNGQLEAMEYEKPRGTWRMWTIVPGLVGVLAFAAALFYRHETAPRPAVLKVESEPTGASLFVNGEFRGTTPVEIGNLRAGKHLLRLTLFHHRSWQQEVLVTEGGKRVDAILEYRKGGKLAVKSEPAGATVYVDGDPKGVTPMTVADLDPGLHALRLVLPDYKEWESTQTVTVDKTTNVEARMVLRIEDYLVRMTQVDPDLLANWSDMFHFYIVTKQYEKAPNALAHGLDALIREPARNDPYKGRLDAELVKLWSGQGDVVLKPEEIRKSRDCIEQGYEQAVSMQPDNMELYGRLVFFYGLDENIEKGNAVLEKGLAKFPTNRGWYLTEPQQMRTNISAQACKRRLADHPDDMVSRVRLVTLLERDNALDEAIAEYPPLIERFKSSPMKFTWLKALGSLYERRRRMDEAVATYEKALLEEPEAQYRAEVLYRIVRIKRDAGDIEAAVMNWEKAIAAQPDVEYACRWRHQLAVLCSENGREAKARSLCEEILTLSKAESTRKDAETLLEKLAQKPAETPAETPGGTPPTP